MFSLKSTKAPIALKILIEYNPGGRSLGLSKMIEIPVKEILEHSLIDFRWFNVLYNLYKVIIIFSFIICYICLSAHQKKIISHRKKLKTKKKIKIEESIFLILSDSVGIRKEQEQVKRDQIRKIKDKRDLQMKPKPEDIDSL